MDYFERGQRKDQKETSMRGVQKSRFHGQLCMGICVIIAWPPLYEIEQIRGGPLSKIHAAQQFSKV